MNELTTFSSSDFGTLRTVNLDNSPWFVGRDVAEKLGYTHPIKDVLKHVDQEDRKVLKPVDFPQKYRNGTFKIPPRGLTIINESGLYSLILASKLPQAKQFKHWVTSEVLPAIRQHGFYATKETVSQFLSNPDAMLELLNQVSEERSAHIATESALQETKRQLQDTQKQLASMRPYPFMIRLGEEKDDTTTISDLAKAFANSGIPIGRNKLFAKLRDLGFIRQDSCLPTLEATKSGYLVIVEHLSDSGSPYYTTGVTTLGRLYFYGLIDEMRAKQRKSLAQFPHAKSL